MSRDPVHGWCAGSRRVRTIRVMSQSRRRPQRQKPRFVERTPEDRMPDFQRRSVWDYEDEPEQLDLFDEHDCE